MQSSHIAKLWRTSFTSESPPTAFQCRYTLHNRWLRIHSLPSSKRYAESELEKAEILRRHNEVATHVLGDASPCVLFITCFHPSLDQETLALLPASLELSLVPELQSIDENEDDSTIHIYAAELQWHRDSLDSLISAVADEEIEQIFFANLWRRTAYAPYDGGADLFLDSSSAVANTKHMWNSWLSFREDGL